MATLASLASARLITDPLLGKEGKIKGSMIILGIETSCDETSAAVIKISRGRISVLSNIVSSQIEIHKEFGGVVPEVAARHHVQNIGWVIDEAISQAKINYKKIDLIAVTAGPGLITSLIVGVEAAKALSLAWQKPLVAINHMYGHIAANFLNLDLSPFPSLKQGGGDKFPALCLVVSGGHTELVLLKNYQQYKKIGQTVDDAAGEAFDKVAKLLHLGYPGGPIVSQRAVDGDSAAFKFPRPMIESPNFNFSFSGLKTAVLYQSQKINLKNKQNVNDICASFQQAVVAVLVGKTIKAAKKYKAETVMLAGGVAANKELREKLRQESEKLKFNFLVPEFKLCTDNAAMIGVAAYYLSQKKMPKIDNWKKITADSNWELD